MTKKDLEQIVRLVLMTANCTRCSREFDPKNVILSKQSHEGLLFELICPCGGNQHCSVNFDVSVPLSKRPSSEKKLKYSSHPQFKRPITPDDVIGVHSALKGFEGDLKNLLYND